MGYTKAQLEEKNRELRARIEELEAKDAESRGKIKGLEDDKKTLQKRIGTLEEQVQFLEAATKSANEAEKDQRDKVRKLEQQIAEMKTPNRKTVRPDRSNLSEGCRAFLEQAEQQPEKETILETDAMIKAAEEYKDNPFFQSFMAGLKEARSEGKTAEERSYIELSSDDDDDDDDDDDEDDDEDDDDDDDDSEGAPYGRSVTGEYLDPDEEQ